MILLLFATISNTHSRTEHLLLLSEKSFLTPLLRLISLFLFLIHFNKKKKRVCMNFYEISHTLKNQSRFGEAVDSKRQQWRDECCCACCNNGLHQ